MSRLVFKHINQQINAILSMDSEVIQQLTELGSCYLSLHISPFKDPFYLKLIDGKATLSGSKPRSPIDIEIQSVNLAGHDLVVRRAKRLVARQKG